MKTTISIAAAALVAAAIIIPAPAHADCRGCGVGAGVVGGLAAGAIIGSALAGKPMPAARSAASRLEVIRAPCRPERAAQ